MKKIFFLFSLFNLLMLITLSAQDKVTLSGIVTDNRGEKLPYVTIAVEGTTIGTSTNDKGEYSLPLTLGTHTLVISHMGYQIQRQTVDLHGVKKLNFKLKEDVVALSSVEVYGKSQAQQLKEGALAVNALSLEPHINSLNSLNSLVNRTTGVKVREEGGVGSDFDLSINGMSGNSVRYFLDGTPLDAKGSEVSLANLPVNLIERIEIYKGVVPAYLGTDALGGAVNIITKRERMNYLDVSYGMGSFHTHKADLNAQYVAPKTGLIIKPAIGLNYSKNDYMMKEVDVWNEEAGRYLPTSRRRFHDDYFSLLAQVEMGVRDKTWTDEFFVSSSFSKVNKEIQTGSVQSKVIGAAERRGKAWNVASRYKKHDFLMKRMNMSAYLSHTWDMSLTVDTAFRKYDWDGNYIYSARNEINGRNRTLRHYKRPLTVLRTNWDYSFNEHHSLNFNYMMNRTGNKRSDEVDTSFEPSNDVVFKHILSLSYNQSFFDSRINNVFFVKDYINHANIEQTDIPTVTGSREHLGSTTKDYWGYGSGTRFRLAEPFALKASYEHSVRLPLAHELLGNGTTIYANVALKPETSENVNAGFFGTWHLSKGHTIYYEVNGFLRFVDNYIQATVSEKEGTMQYENEPAIHIKGVEGEIRYNWLDKLHLSANFSFQEARDQQQYLDNGKLSATYKNRLPNRPWLFGGLEADYTFPKVGMKDGRLRVSANYQWVHWYFLTWEAYGTKENKARIPEQNVINADVSYSWKNGRYNVALECSNLLDKIAYDNYKLQKPGRAFFAKFRIFIN